eukprot:6132681-Amphidinium_carterae.1
MKRDMLTDLDKLKLASQHQPQATIRIRKEKTLESVNVGIPPLAPKLPQNNKKHEVGVVVVLLLAVAMPEGSEKG